MNEFDQLLVSKMVEKITGQWTPEMINDLTFRLESYLIDKHFTEAEQSYDPNKVSKL